MKKRLVIMDQPALSWRRTVRITLDGVRYRLFRAAVTVAVIAVAVAFLMNILSESLIKRRVAADTRAKLADRALIHAWAARLTEPPTLRATVTTLAGEDPGEAPRRAEMLAMGKQAAGGLEASCREAAHFIAFIESLDYARRRNLVHTASGTAILDHLQQPEAMAAFRDSLHDLKSIRLPMPLATLDALLQTWPALKANLTAICNGYTPAIHRAAAVRGTRPIMEALAANDTAFVAAVREAGFAFDAATASRVAEEAAMVLDGERVERSLVLPAARQALAGRFRVEAPAVSTALLWTLLHDADGASWYHAQLAAAGDRSLPDPARLVALAKAHREDAQLVLARTRTTDVGAGWLGLGRRMSWLLLVSMLVCAIGIANAMLMTVTERFREIATMKCLGALDHIIMLMFTLEACVFGLVGGIVGASLGCVIGIGRMAAQFGSALHGTLPVRDLLLGTLAAVGCGIALAAVAALYPSFKAARLAPMEAMRTE